MNASTLNNLPQEIKALKTFVLWESATDKKGAPGKRHFGVQS
jgi:hypothetical protein